MSQSVVTQESVNEVFKLAQVQGWHKEIRVVCADAAMPQEESTLRGWRIVPEGPDELDTDQLPVWVQERVAAVRSLGVPIQGWLTFHEPKPQLGDKQLALAPSKISTIHKVLAMVGTGALWVAAAIAAVAVVATVIYAFIPLLIIFAAVVLGLGVDPVLTVCVGDDPEHCTHIQIAAWMDEE